MKKTVLLVLVLLSSIVLHAQCNLSSTTSVTAATCFGTNNGTATINTTGGTPPYTYNWNTSPSQSGNTATNLFAGTYTVLVTDATSGCVSTGQNLIVNGDFESGNTGFTSGHTYCNTNNCMGCSACEGRYTIDVNPALYNGAFVGNDHTTGSGNFMIVNGATNSTLSVWCQSVPVNQFTNYNFSAWISSVVTSSPAQLQVKINGVTIGSTFYAPSTTYTWSQLSLPWNSGAATTANICIYNLNTALGGNDFGIDDISFGPCVPVTACTDTVTVVITEPTKVDVNLSAPDLDCFGDTTTALATASGGTPGYSFLWIPGMETTQNNHGLGAGTYYLQTKDGNNCTRFDTITINSPPEILTTITSLNNVSCFGDNNGSASIAVTGGAPSYMYNWTPSVGTGPSVSGLSGGTYQLLITDSLNCSKEVEITITEPDELFLSLEADSTACQGGGANVEAKASGGLTPYIYNWSNGFTGSTQYLQAGTTVQLTLTDANNCIMTANYTVPSTSSIVADFKTEDGGLIFSTSQINFLNTTTNGVSWWWDFGDGTTSSNEHPGHTYSTTGTYHITLIAYSPEGCPDTAYLTIEITDELLEIPNVFSPNGDGTNDIFQVKHAGYENLEIRIVNRWGREMWKGMYHEGWDGRTKSGAMASPGTYYYVLDAYSKTGNHVLKSGFLTLVR